MAVDTPRVSPTEARSLTAARRALLRWYARHRRDLPWRRRRDAYAIWLSEIMLQQTRVDVVVPYYEAFLQRFPSITALAAAPLDDVLQQWAGLGYYTRARSLHRAAQQVVREHDGHFPTTRDAVLALPGIGRYTAGAILSIAFGQRQPIVDGNVMRVLARWFAMQEDIDQRPTQERFWAWASLWASGRNPGDANQALMELGATRCHRTSPACPACPVQRWCRARHLNLQDTLPRRSARPKTQSVSLAALLLRQRGRILLVRRLQSGLLQDFWEIPTARLEEGASAPDATQPARLRRVLARHGIRLDTWTSRGAVQHGILHHRLQVHVLEASGHLATSPRPMPARARRALPTRREDSAASPLENLGSEVSWRWTTAREANQLALSTLTRKVLRVAARADSTWEHYVRQNPSQEPARQRRHEPS